MTLDFSPGRIRRSVENSLRLLKTDYVDILQFHDIEFVPLASGVRGLSTPNSARCATRASAATSG